MTNISTTERDLLYYMEEMVDDNGVFEVRTGRLQHLADNVGIGEDECRRIIKKLMVKGHIEKVVNGYMLV